MPLLRLIVSPNKFSLMLGASMFLFLGDAILSYLFPIIVEETVVSFSLVGLILAASSLVGLIFDLIFPFVFPNIDWKLSNLLGVLFGLTFPVFVFLGQDFNQPIFYLIASIVWGIYFEFLGFSRQDGVVELDTEKNFTQTWGIIYALLAFCGFIGPIIASLAFGADQVVARTIVFALYFASVILSFALFRSKDTTIQKKESKLIHTISFVREIRYWAILEVKTFPIFLTLIYLAAVSSFFWTFGGLYGEELFGESGFGWLLLAVYTLPELIFSLAFTKFVIKRRKKFLSFILIILSGATLVPLIFIEEKLMLLPIIFAFSSLNAVTWILVRSVFSDLESRAKEFKVHVEAIFQSTESIGFIIGPLLTGLIIDGVGFKNSLVILGTLSIFIGFFLLIITPEKLKIPIKRLRQI